MNVLSWRTKHGDARERIVPEEFQPHPAFCGQRPVVVQNAPFAATGFTRAHQAGGRQQGWRTLPTLPVEVRRAIAAGEPFVYAYYDGIDKIAHEFGFGEHYDAELAAVDRMVADLLPMLPRHRPGGHRRSRSGVVPRRRTRFGPVGDIVVLSGVG